MQRSRSLLREALEYLAEQRDISDITIRDITDRANLGRATFYLHYQKKDDLVAELLAALLDEIRVSIAQSSAAYSEALERKDAAPGTPIPGGSILDLLDRRKALFRSLAHSSVGLEFRNGCQALYEDAFLQMLHRTGKRPAPGSPSFEYRALYAAGGALAIVWRWLDQPHAPRAEIGSHWTRYITLFLLTENVIDPDTNE